MKLFQSVNLQYSFYLFLFFRKREGENQLVIQGGDGERGGLVLFIRGVKRGEKWNGDHLGVAVVSLAVVA